jgi:hypothetical protein
MGWRTSRVLGAQRQQPAAGAVFAGHEVGQADDAQVGQGHLAQGFAAGGGQAGADAQALWRANAGRASTPVAGSGHSFSVSGWVKPSSTCCWVSCSGVVGVPWRRR